MHSIVRTLTFAAFLGTLSSLAGAQTVIFQEDFNGKSLDGSKWTVASHTLGRTQLGNAPVFVSDKDGTKYASLRFDTYNASAVGQLFKGAEILTKQSFAVNQGLIMEARVRCRKVASGQVCSMFTYSFEDPLTDEIDFEFLTKQPANSILTTTWNDWDYRLDDYVNPVFYESQQTAGSFDRGNWSILEIVWLPGYIEWYVNGQCVRGTYNAVPNSVMNLRFNFWAPASGWTAAFDTVLQPARRSRDNVQYFYDIDYVKVTQL